MRTVVVMPTYNEVATIASMVDALLASPAVVDVLVVDDSSPDGTGNLVRQSARAHPGRVHLLSRQAKTGLGAAYRAGFTWALEHGYDVIVQMDADGSHPVDRLPVVLDALRDGADVAIGSRYVPGGAVVNWPLHRHILSRLANWYARTLLGVNQRDLTGAYRAWPAEALRRLAPERLPTSGFGFLVELAHAAHVHGLTVVEVPITFTGREHGTSKMTGRIAIEAMGMVLRLRRAQHGHRSPTRSLRRCHG
ncbi:MAG: polyprenol monophosphomannose synthase [Actinomycetes bacterium]